MVAQGYLTPRTGGEAAKEGGPCTCRRIRRPKRLPELAARMGVDASTASRQVQQLERTGLVGRVGDPADRRASLLELTAEGNRVLARMRQARRASLAQVLGGWSRADRRTLAAMLTRLVDDLERVTGVRA